MTNEASRLGIAYNSVLLSRHHEQDRLRRIRERDPNWRIGGWCTATGFLSYMTAAPVALKESFSLDQSPESQPHSQQPAISNYLDTMALSTRSARKLDRPHRTSDVRKRSAKQPRLLKDVSALSEFPSPAMMGQEETSLFRLMDLPLELKEKIYKFAFRPLYADEPYREGLTGFWKNPDLLKLTFRSGDVRHASMPGLDFIKVCMLDRPMPERNPSKLRSRVMPLYRPGILDLPKSRMQIDANNFFYSATLFEWKNIAWEVHVQNPALVQRQSHNEGFVQTTCPRTQLILEELIPFSTRISTDEITKEQGVQATVCLWLEGKLDQTGTGSSQEVERARKYLLKGIMGGFPIFSQTERNRRV